MEGYRHGLPSVCPSVMAHSAAACDVEWADLDDATFAAGGKINKGYLDAPKTTPRRVGNAFARENQS
jgi:hypothetical protein